MRKEAMEKAVAVLTDEQKESWKSMTGKIIDIPMGGGGRGGKRVGRLVTIPLLLEVAGP